MDSMRKTRLFMTRPSSATSCPREFTCNTQTVITQRQKDLYTFAHIILYSYINVVFYSLQVDLIIIVIMNSVRCNGRLKKHLNDLQEISFALMYSDISSFMVPLGQGGLTVLWFLLILLLAQQSLSAEFLESSEYRQK